MHLAVVICCVAMSLHPADAQGRGPATPAPASTSDMVLGQPKNPDKSAESTATLIAAAPAIHASQYALHLDSRSEQIAPPSRVRDGQGLMIGGLTVFAVGYVAAGFASAMLLAGTQESCHCTGDGLRLLIPIAGPLTVFQTTPDHTVINTLLVTDTVVQSVGLVLSVIGIARFIAAPTFGGGYGALPPRPRLTVETAPVPGGAYALLVMRM